MILWDLAMLPQPSAFSRMARLWSQDLAMIAPLFLPLSAIIQTAPLIQPLTQTAEYSLILYPIILISPQTSASSLTERLWSQDILIIKTPLILPLSAIIQMEHLIHPLEQAAR